MVYMPTKIILHVDYIIVDQNVKYGEGWWWWVSIATIRKLDE